MINVVVFTILGYALVAAGRLVGNKNPLAQGTLVASGLMSSSCAFWASTAEQWHLVCSYTVWIAVFLAVLNLVSGAIVAGVRR